MSPSRLCALVLAMVAPLSLATPSTDILHDGTAHEALFAVGLAGARAVAVGAGGAILESADGGKTWTATQSPTSLALLGVDVEGDRALAVGQQGLVLSRDADGTWRRVDAGGSERLLAVDVNTRGLSVATGAFGTILKSDDWGAHWQALAVDWTQYAQDGAEPHLYAVHVDERDRITVAGEFGLILRSDDGGSHWRRLHEGEASIFAFDLHAPGTASYAVGQIGTVLRSLDGGESWSPLASVSTSNLLGVRANAGQVLITGFRESAVSTDGGESWTVLADLVTGNRWLSGVAAAREGHAIAVGQFATVVQVRVQ